MVLDERKRSSSEPDLDILGLRLGANRLADGAAAYEAGNEVVVRRKKREALYRNGSPRWPAFRMQRSTR